MGIEQAVYMIKPEGMLVRDEIRSDISEAGLVIIKRKVVLVDKEALDTIYPENPEIIQEATLAHMVSEYLEMGVVEAEGAIKRLTDICGHHFNPEVCHEGTIRRKYGHPALGLGNGFFYCPNAIHCSKSPEEATRDLGLFERLSLNPAERKNA
jgi:nucleoside diphosphate kinase